MKSSRVIVSWGFYALIDVQINQNVRLHKRFGFKIESNAVFPPADTLWSGACEWIEQQLCEKVGEVSVNSPDFQKEMDRRGECIRLLAAHGARCAFFLHATSWSGN